MSLQLQHVNIFWQGKPMFPEVDLIIEPGQILTIMGPSGCGKSTLLAALNGSLSSNMSLTGHMLLNDQAIESLSIEQRKIGMLFQDDLLFPHMNVAGNLMFALPGSLTKAEKRERIAQALAGADLSGFQERDIATLSGGQRARVSLLRAVLAEPKALLMDEPFSKLDTELRQNFREFVFAQIKLMNIPAMMVTHDSADCFGQQAYLLHQGVMTEC